MAFTKRRLSPASAARGLATPSRDERGVPNQGLRSEIHILGGYGSNRSRGRGLGPYVLVFDNAGRVVRSAHYRRRSLVQIYQDLNQRHGTTPMFVRVFGVSGVPDGTTLDRVPTNIARSLM